MYYIHGIEGSLVNSERFREHAPNALAGLRFPFRGEAEVNTLVGQQMQKKVSRGFTMIELIMVIVIVVILASIAYPVFINIQERGHITQDMNNLRQLGLAALMYMNDNDGVVFSTSAGAGTWMSQLQPKYIAAWKVFQSAFDTRPSSEKGDATTPISFGLNGNPNTPAGGSSIAGLLSDKITNPSVFILFASAQASGTTVTFQGTAATAAPGVTVLGQGAAAQSAPGGSATGGTHNNRKRITACMADLHVENMAWSVFTNNAKSPPSDACGNQRWDPTATCP
jgi:prepilin-type N-terminal cleavage/methylation domain-containing protein